MLDGNQEPQGSAAKLWLVAKELHNPRAFDSRLLPSNTAKRQLQTAEGPLQRASMKKFEQPPILSAAFGAAHAPQPRDHGSSQHLFPVRFHGNNQERYCQLVARRTHGVTWCHS